MKALKSLMTKERIISFLFIWGMLIGLMIAVYPFLASWWNTKIQTGEAVSYQSQASTISTHDLDQLWNEVHQWNDQLEEYGMNESLEDSYSSLLSIDNDKNSVIGSLSIPSIDVTLPIYHSTDDSVLEKGVGHLEESSMIEGGKGRHTVLTGHRGLPGSRLFTDLNYVKIGDVFSISSLGKTLYYEVDQIKTVLPEDISDLSIDPDEDYATLITCTPYGLNTHRLLVRGKRIDKPAEEKLEPDIKAKSYKWILPVLTALTAILLILLIGWYYRKYQQKTKSE